MARRTTRTALAVVAGALLLAGCGGDGGEGSSTTTETPTIIGGFQVLEVFDVHESEFSLDPETIEIDRFGYYGIRAVNDGDVAHALTVEGHGVDQTTGTIEPGKSKAIAIFFRRVGTYKLYCPIDGHEADGMEGTITVK